MSTEQDVRKQAGNELSTDTEAEHSMTSQQDQLIVEERERERDAISRAKPRRTDDANTVPDPDTRDGTKMPGGSRGA